MITTANIRELTLTTLRNNGITDETAMENAVRAAQGAIRPDITNDEVIAGIRSAVAFGHEIADRMDAEYGPQRFTYLDRKREPEPKPPRGRVAQFFDRWMCP